MKKGNTKGARWVYNFIFPFGCQQLTIYGYVFRRVDEYRERVQSLQHLIHFHSEFDQPANTGTHAITAHLDLPSKEKKPVIEWGDEKATALDDILLLLSIFNLRDVFAVPEPIEKGKGAITADSREYFFGLRTSIEYQQAQDEKGAIDIATAPLVRTATEVAGRLPGEERISRNGPWAPAFRIQDIRP